MDTMLKWIAGLLGYDYITAWNDTRAGVVVLDGLVVDAVRMFVKKDQIRGMEDVDGGPGAFGVACVIDGVRGDRVVWRWKRGHLFFRVIP